MLVPPPSHPGKPGLETRASFPGSSGCSGTVCIWQRCLQCGQRSGSCLVPGAACSAPTMPSAGGGHGAVSPAAPSITEALRSLGSGMSLLSPHAPKKSTGIGTGP